MTINRGRQHRISLIQERQHLREQAKQSRLRRQSEAAKIRSEIKALKAKIVHYSKKAADQTDLMHKYEQDLIDRNYGKWKTHLKVDIERTRAKVAAKIHRSRIRNHHLRIAQLECLLVLELADIPDRMTPGEWRWINGMEGTAVWETSGRVGLLKKSKYTNGWTLHVLKPMKRGLFRFTGPDGGRFKVSFSTIVKSSSDGEIVLFSTPQPMTSGVMAETSEPVYIRMATEKK